MGSLIEVQHRTDKYIFMLADFDGKKAEFGCSWIPQTKTLRIELSSMFGCICNCSHCEYSYKYQGEISCSDMSDQFITAKTATQDFWHKASKIVISFCRMGEPTLNPYLLDFIREVWAHFRHKRHEIVFEIPTVLPEDGVKSLLQLKAFAATSDVRIRPIVTINAVDSRNRRNITGHDMVHIDQFNALLDGWKERPLILLQPIEVGFLTSWEIKKNLKSDQVDMAWNHINTTIPIKLLGHKLMTMRSNYETNIKCVTKGLADRGVNISNGENDIPYPAELTPGSVFSILMKDRLIRKVAELKAVK